MSDTQNVRRTTEPRIRYAGNDVFEFRDEQGVWSVLNDQVTPEEAAIFTREATVRSYHGVTPEMLADAARRQHSHQGVID